MRIQLAGSHIQIGTPLEATPVDEHVVETRRYGRCEINRERANASERRVKVDHRGVDPVLEHPSGRRRTLSHELAWPRAPTRTHPRVPSELDFADWALHNSCQFSTQALNGSPDLAIRSTGAVDEQIHS